MKKIFLLFGIIFLFSLASSVTLNQGIILNTTSSNSSINFSFSVNVSSFTVEPNYILLNEINFTNSTGSYNCADINHSTSNSVMDSSEFNCSIIVTPVITPVITPPVSSGAITAYLKEKSSGSVVSIRTIIYASKEKSINISDDKDTGIVSLKINAKEYINGNIEISKIEKKPDYCIIPEIENYEIYKILNISHSFDNEKVGSVELDVIINNTWIKEKNISKVISVKCFPESKVLNTSLLNLENSTYKIESDGFSVWVIGGAKEKEVQKEDTIKEIPDEKKVRKINITKLFILFLIILIFIVYLIKRKKKNSKKRIVKEHYKRRKSKA